MLHQSNASGLPSDSVKRGLRQNNTHDRFGNAQPPRAETTKLAVRRIWMNILIMERSCISTTRGSG